MQSLGSLFFLFLIFSCSSRSIYRDHSFDKQTKIKFCFLGDLGLGTSLQKRMAEALQNEECDRIYFLGDLIYSPGLKGADDPILEERFLSYYRPLYQKDPSLQLNLVLGNHDYDIRAEDWFEVAESNKNIFFPSHFYFEDFGGLCILSLDTNLLVYSSYVFKGLSQALWLMGNMNRIKDCKASVAVSHHPYKGGNYSGSKRWKGAQGMMKRFLENWVIGEVDFHIAGHVHMLKDVGEKEGTRMLISGTGGEVLGGGTPGYVVLIYNRKVPDKIEYFLRRLK